MPGGEITLKILCLGPTTVGKSTICNFLYGIQSSKKGINNPKEKHYRPTVGVRILEFDREITLNDDSLQNTKLISVELWDCSGDKKYDYTWPAILQDVDGILFVFNPEKRNHDRELEAWFHRFAVPLKLNSDQCLIFSHDSGELQEGGRSRFKLIKSLAEIHLINTSLEDDPEGIREEFDIFLEKIMTTVHRNQEKMEGYFEDDDPF